MAASLRPVVQRAVRLDGHRHAGVARPRPASSWRISAASSSGEIAMAAEAVAVGVSGCALTRTPA
jgi:hypothetical protein